MLKLPLRNTVFLVGGLLVYLSVVQAQDTFSIVAVDPRTHEVGSAGASCVGGPVFNVTVITDVIEGVGAIHTQAFYLAANQQIAHQRMVAGDSPQQIIQYVLAHDAGGDSTIRQYGVVDFIGGGRSAAYTGLNTNDYKGHITGPSYAIQGNILLGKIVLDTMQYAFLHTPGPLADRLMAALRAAKMPGADQRCLPDLSSLSAFVRVVRIGDGTNEYLYQKVTYSTTIDPIDSLQKLFDAWKDSLAARPDRFTTSISVDRDSVIINGFDQATIKVTVRNNSNVPLGSGFDVQISSAGPGTLGPVTYQGNGVYAAQLSPSGLPAYTKVTATVNDSAVGQFQLLDTIVVAYILPKARTWVGGVNSFWTNSINWSPKGVPAFFDTVVVPSASVLPVYDGTSRTIEVTSVRILPGGSLTIPNPDVSLVVRHNCELYGSLFLNGTSNGAYTDTLVLLNPNPAALTGEGEIPTGIVQRLLQPGAIGMYRFQTDHTLIQFDGTGVYPSKLAVTAFSDTPATAFANFWVVVPSTVNSIAHAISTSSVIHFSNWYFGTPSSLGATPHIRRVYRINEEGGHGFRAQLTLPYHASEVDAGIAEETLQLLQEGTLISDTVAYRTFKADSIALARDNKGIIGKLVKPRKGMPNAVNVLEQSFKVGAFPGNPMGDSLGGIVIGVSYLRLKDGKYVVNPDSAKKYGWVRLGKWNGRKNTGQNYQDVLKTLFKKPMVLQSGTSRKFDFFKEKKSISPSKYNNKLLGDQIALKVSILASQTGITPPGLGELVYNDGTSNPLNGRMVRQIAALCDTFLTLGNVPTPNLTADVFETTIHNIDSAFDGPIDTVSFVDSLVLQPVRALTSVPFLHSIGVPPVVIFPPRNNVEDIASRISLSQNYPNPFNPTTSVEFELPEPAIVTLNVYNVLGQVVAELLNQEELDMGTHELEFDAQNLASGVYFYQLVVEAIEDEENSIAQSGSRAIVKKMLLLR